MNSKLLPAVILLMIAGATLAQPDTQEAKKIGDFTVIKALPRLPVLDQGNTGTCWCFATTSFLETELKRIHGKDVDLSELFTVRHTTIEKAKAYVDDARQLARANRGKKPAKAEGGPEKIDETAWPTRGNEPVFGEGGLSHDVIAMARKYGVVPQSAYSGLREGQRRHNHGEMFRSIKGMIDALSKSRRRLSPFWVDAVSGIIDSYLGPAPETFEWEGKQITPKQFADDVLKIPYDDYIEVMSYGYAPFHSRAMLTVRDNWMKYDQYLNVPLDEFMDIFDHALSTGYSIAVDIDVSEKTYKPRQGIGTLSEELEKKGAVTQEVRDRMFKSRDTTDDHLMHVVGVAEKDGKRYYITKDSWGARHGKLSGYRMLSENYIRAKVLAFMIHKDGMPKRE